MKDRKGLWFGWSGEESESGRTGHIDTQTSDGVTTATLDLSQRDIDEYYNGYANRTLWPLFHYRMDLAEYVRSFGSGYERVNKRFAETLQPLIESDDAVWVHDYHLIPLAWDLRRQGVKNRMGFFLHTPWPPTRLLVALPHHQRLVQSLFAYDVLGFQTEEWLESFRHYCEKEMGGTIDGDDITVGSRTIKAFACPIGIDYDEFLDAVNSENAANALTKMRASLQDRAMIVGVDRLDYSKGLEERFQGFEKYLSDHPEMHTHVVLVQVAPPSRGEVKSYQEIRASLEAESGRINGRFAHVDWTPIRYVNKGYPRDQLGGIYRAAKVGLVTPLRDGMNLVAKEYVAAQDPQDPGVLILSRFAGAAQQLTEALLINPYSDEEMADAIHQALTMPLEERKRRWKIMMDEIGETDVVWWRETYVNKLMQAQDVESAEDKLLELSDEE